MNGNRTYTGSSHPGRQDKVHVQIRMMNEEKEKMGGSEGYISAGCKVVAIPPSFALHLDIFLSRQPTTNQSRIERRVESSPHKATDKFHRPVSTCEEQVRNGQRFISSETEGR